MNAIQPFDHALWKLANHMLDINIKAEFSSYPGEFHEKLSAFQEFNERATNVCKQPLQEKNRMSNSSSAIEKDSRNRCEALFRDNSDAVKFAWEELNVIL